MAQGQQGPCRPTASPARALRQRLGEMAAVGAGGGRPGHTYPGPPSTEAPPGRSQGSAGGGPRGREARYDTNRPAGWGGEGAAGRRRPAAAGRHGDAWGRSACPPPSTAMGPKRPKTGGVASAGAAAKSWEAALVSAHLEEVKAAEGQGRGRQAPDPNVGGGWGEPGLRRPSSLLRPGCGGVAAGGSAGSPGWPRGREADRPDGRWSCPSVAPRPGPQQRPGGFLAFPPRRFSFWGAGYQVLAGSELFINC